MPTLIDGYNVSLEGCYLGKDMQDDAWNSHALLDVADPKHFSVSIRPVPKRPWSEISVIVGIVPEDANLCVNDIESHCGVFLLHKLTSTEVIDATGDTLRFDLPGLDDCLKLQQCPALGMTYDDGELYFALEGHSPALVPVTIPTAEYRPCISIPDSLRFSVAVDAPSRKRKRDEEEVRAVKINKSLWAERKFTDATVVCGEQSFPVHRCVLAASSLFFARAFEGSMKESVEARVVIKDADAGCVEVLLSYLYTGQIDGCINAAALLPVAHRLEVSALVEHCAAALAWEINSENIVSTVAALRPYMDNPAVKPHWDVIASCILADGSMVRALMCQ